MFDAFKSIQLVFLVFKEKFKIGSTLRFVLVKSRFSEEIVFKESDMFVLDKFTLSAKLKSNSAPSVLLANFEKCNPVVTLALSDLVSFKKESSQ
jgi:hypothetical protein